MTRSLVRSHQGDAVWPADVRRRLGLASSTGRSAAGILRGMDIDRSKRRDRRNQIIGLVFFVVGVPLAVWGITLLA